MPPIPGRNVILENGRRGYLNSIYFEPDTAVLIESYRPVLHSVGRQLAADSSMRLLIRAYAADFGTSDGRYIVSVDRARFSRDFLNEQYGIALSRFSIEAYGADKTPIYATEDWVSHRCVELILVED
jgi:outer membrane protein OmpA-like peptidoglycan-associated protein